MKFSIASALAFATLAAATHTVTVTSPPPNQTPPPASQCNTDNLYCCNQSQLAPANNSIIAGLLSIIGVVVQPVTALVGANCSPIDVLGIGSGGQCTQQPVCCQNNDFFGLGVVIGCSPVTI